MRPELGRRRRLLRLAGPRGAVVGLAIDHRESLRDLYRARGATVPPDRELAALKARLVRVLAPLASVVLLDLELGRDALRLVPPAVALVMPLEAPGHEPLGEARLTRLLADFSPADAARLGADACKLLVHYRPDVDEAARRQDELVTHALADCHAVGLPLVVEPIVYRLAEEDEAAFRPRFADLVIETARRLAALGVDILKLQFPESADAAACAELDAACGAVPWTLLGGGGDPEGFDVQLRVACAAGASGFVVGRTVWDAALDRDPAESERRAVGVCAPLLRRFREIAEARCRPLADRLGSAS